MNKNWFNGIPVAITVSDTEGRILEMNDASGKVFEKYGGKDLIGNLLKDCHNNNSMAIMNKMLQEGSANVYTIEKNGIKKMIFQCPWYNNNEIAGLVEFSFVIPAEMPHFVRS